MAKEKLKFERHRNSYRERIPLAHVNGPDQNTIIFSTLNLASPEKSLLTKVPSCASTSRNINWYKLHKDFTKCLNQLCYKAKQSESHQDQQNKHQTQEQIQSKNYHSNNASPSPKQSERYVPLYKLQVTNFQRLELGIDNIEKDLFNPELTIQTSSSIAKQKTELLKEIKS